MWTQGNSTPEERERCMGKILAGIMVFVLAGIGSPAVCQDLTIVTEDFPPLNYIHDENLAGSSTAVVREILRRHGRQHPIQVLPWARAYRLLKTGPNVMLYSIVRAAQREPLFYWVGPLYTQTRGFYALRDSGTRISSMEPAKRVPRIGTCRKDGARTSVARKHGASDGG
jgi:polar amino acid transport system substrate-binding protein